MTEFSAGVFLVDKPAGPSSFFIVRQIRRIVGIKKVGHAGTLDPFATGLLIVCAGRSATKMISSFMDGDKEYLATLCLGKTTTTLDPEGEILRESPVGHIDSETVEQCLASFRGELLQRPPSFSAVKHKGKPLYHYARKGITIEKEPRRIQIHELERVDGHGDITGEFPQLSFRVRCSKGTYIRTLAADIGDKLGCGGYLTALRRTASGNFSVDNAIDGALLGEPDMRGHILNNMLSVEDVANSLQ